jgi:2-(1,2-epoxy-1,2-dihydrophenyl)acetyl-CoA isomerase
MSEAAVLFDLREGVATLTLNQPDRLNPLAQPIVDGLLQALQRVRDDASVRAVLLTGAGRGFCVGADLADLAGRAQGPESLGRHVGRLMEEGGNPVIAGLRSLPVPVVCAVNGPAAGGGVGLALAADVTIAARSAYFYLPFVPALGLVPDMGSSWVLPRVLGRARALGLALTGDKLPAERAAAWGLVWACVDDADLGAQSAAMAARLAALPAGAVQELRALYDAAERHTLPEQLGLERQRQEQLIDGPSFAEGLAAFNARRKPSFPPRQR